MTDDTDDEKKQKKPARNVMEGKVGDRFLMARRYSRDHVEAIGLPLGTPRGKPVSIPPRAPGPPAPHGATGPYDHLVEYVRPDFRKVDKHEPALKPRDP
ncbi:hypothetical protein GCK72_006885 [Caenorhabditis remanei]|uniref:Uncharacterized protein n=1 Tax=Caenorhabditis remanei TaxID=31234 RepID=A0A6A5HK05_CAERE|nr:hypothetical protein GCK72_006885 [Caenorhabditis remanei]KAF1766927.1 hypothetical protein GCK72_006885 [Caenorhabditis remanei]